jgi:quercetin dioxygenase-like cupin family protein
MTDPTNPEGTIGDAATTPQLALYGVTSTQVIRLQDVIEFRGDKRVRKKLFEGAQLWGELLCYEAGQATPSHHHPTEDELFVILEGHAAVLAGDNELDAPAVSLVIVPANVPHDLRNVGSGRLVVMFVKLSALSAKPQRFGQGNEHSVSSTLRNATGLAKHLHNAQNPAKR